MTAYALRLQNSTDTAARARIGDLLGLTPGATAVTARTGIRPGVNAGAVAVVAGTMDVTVQPFVAWIQGGVSVVQGGYPFVLDAQATLTLANGHASLSRTDVVAAVVRDDPFDSSGAVTATVEVIQGTAGGGVPALPENALPLRNVTVPAGLSTGTGGLASGNLSTDRRAYTAAAGGVVPVANKTERDALPAINGTVVYRTDLDTLQVRRASGWDTVATDPTTHSSATLGPSGNFNNTTQGNWTISDWSFTPTRDGYATITATLDTQDVTAGYGSASVYIKVGGVQVDSQTLRFEGPRLNTRVTTLAPVKVTEGVLASVTMDVACFSSAGAWKINALTWTAVVQ